MNWVEKAHRAAKALDMEAIEATDPEDVQYGFREGARWQREALLSDEAIERAARTIAPVLYYRYDEWGDERAVGRVQALRMARAALAAAIGDDDE